MIEKIAKILNEKNLTISIAESLTGGMVSSKFVDYSSISSVFIEGCVTYSNDSKIKRLGVREETLKDFGAVSSQTAMEMAYGISKTSNTNIGISTTGIAGPLGGSKEKPVGLVYIGICINEKTITKKYNFDGNRNEIRNKATSAVINDLLEELEKLN
jgi:nicotinamide-nucleotide amidase